jgi:nicotinic acid phosphoribosyltransferase
MSAAGGEGGEGGGGGPAADGGDLLAHFMDRATELSGKGVTINVVVDVVVEDKPTPTPKDLTFLEILDNFPAFGEIIRKFSYPDGDTSTVVDDNGLINAFFANDLYKLSMAPVIHHVTLDNGGCVVQFKVDLRTYSTFNEVLKKEYVTKSSSTFETDLVDALDKLKEREFDRDTFDDLVNVPYNQDANPPVAKWKDNRQFLYPIKDRNLTATTRKEIMDHYNNISGAVLSDNDFHTGTCILKCIPVPKDPKAACPVALSVFFVPGDESPDIRATGFWPWCSWLETPLMQTAYEVMHRYYLKEILPKVDKSRKNTYGAWMAESLFRTFTGISFLQKSKDPSKEPIKVALFSGRRTGGALFNLLQVYLWDKFDKPGTPLGGGRNLGTSSFWALQTLGGLGFPCQILPSGTHAHELSMTLNVLYGDKLDRYDRGFVGSQILGHLLYKYLSAGNTATPMLTDTVGTRSFLETAIQLKDGDKAALCSFVSARQDSGTLEEYKQLMEYYAVTIANCKMPSLMASEIDERNQDFKKAMDLHYKLAGVGGALGDSEKIDHEMVLDIREWPSSKNKEPLITAFGASEAAKITRVWGGNGTSGYTLKTGDNAGKDKVTFDKKAVDERAELEARAELFQGLHQAALKELNENGNITLLPLEEAELLQKQQILNEALRRIIARERGHTVAEKKLPASVVTGFGPSKEVNVFDIANLGIMTRGGGRRTRRKVRKVTKKYVRKNIRKSKHIRNRRSNRRNSRK